MTNRYSMNRKYVKKTKLLRDRKKAKSVGNKRKNNTEEPQVYISSKKHEKRQERLSKIFESKGVSEDIAEKKNIKRRHKNTRKGGKYTIVNSKQISKEMEIED